MEQYDKYKPSGVEWIGEIPEHWDLKRIKYEVDYQKGKNPKELTFDEKGKVYLTMEYLRNNPKQTFFVEDYDNYVTVGENEILLLWDGSNAGEFIKSKDGILSSTMASLKIHKIDTNYAWYFFKVFERQLRESTIGMGVPHVNGEEFKNQNFIIPIKLEQSAIANYLDEKTAQIDTLIANKQKLIELLKEERTAVINQAVTKGIAPRAKLKPSGIEWLGDIPVHWEVKKLKYLLRIKSGDGIKSEEIDFEGTYPVFGGNGILGYTENFNSDRLDIIIGRVGAKCGNVRLVEGKKWISDNALVIDLFEGYDYKFISILLESINLNSLANQNAQPLITGTLVRDKMVAIPIKVEEQNQIVQHIETETKRIDGTISKIEKEIELLQEYRIALISEVVTGKLCVYKKLCQSRE